MSSCQNFASNTVDFWYLLRFLCWFHCSTVIACSESWSSVLTSFYLSSSHLFFDTKKKVNSLIIFPVSSQFATMLSVWISFCLYYLEDYQPFMEECISFQFYFQFIYLSWMLLHIILDFYILIIDTFLIISVYHCLPLHHD